MKRLLFAATNRFAATTALFAAATLGQRAAAVDVNPFHPDLEKLEFDLHANPELSFHESHTSAKIAERLRRQGPPAWWWRLWSCSRKPQP
jgi:hypothetical protein